MNDNNLRKAVVDFVYHFERVFDRDWVFTDHVFRQLVRHGDPYIAADGTFLHPDGPGGDPENLFRWENRGALLDSYARLKTLLEGCGR